MDDIGARSGTSARPAPRRHRLIGSTRGRFGRGSTIFSGAGGTKCATSRGANGSVISNTRAPADLPSCRFALFKPSKPYFWRSTSRHCPEFDTADEDRERLVRRPGGAVKSFLPGDKRVLSPDQRRDFDEARRLGKSRLGAEDLVRTAPHGAVRRRFWAPAGRSIRHKVTGRRRPEGRDPPPVLPPCFPTV